MSASLAVLTARPRRLPDHRGESADKQDDGHKLQTILDVADEQQLKTDAGDASDEKKAESAASRQASRRPMPRACNQRTCNR
jgi:hypothetical protein